MTIRLLLVDDHNILLSTLHWVLDKQPDIEIIGTALDGYDAIRLSEELVPDVILMDIALPGLGGVEATRRILKFLSSTKVLALSQYSDEEAVSEMLIAGAIGYVTKTCSIEELLLAIRAVAAGNPYFSQKVSSPLLTAFVEKHLSQGTKLDASHLTGRQVEVLQLVSEGNALADIAQKLDISVRTVESHISHLKSKLRITTLAGLIKYAIKNRYTSVDF